ncbi:MAG TPA: SMC family ATPase [Dehalococcoidia bacterium]
MRPRNLQLAGFTCYSDPVEIDFSDLDLFVISGPTGAGKSTIIDAICYALYGRVPRSDAKSTTALISHNRDNMRVALEFEVAHARYRVSRGINVSRKTARDGNEKISRNESPVVLERLVGDAWTPIEGRAGPIDDEVERIIGLDFDGFTKCVLLPQGRFQEFLTGEARERRKLLIELLGTGIYDRVGVAARARAGDLTTQADGISRRLREDYADATQDALDAARTELADIRPKLGTAKEERDALQQAVGFAAAVVAARHRGRERTQQHATAIARASELKALARDGEQQIIVLRVEIASIEQELAALAYDASLHGDLRMAYEIAKRCASIDRERTAASAAASATDALESATAAFAAAEAASKDATAAYEAAQARRTEAQRAHAADALRGDLKRGDACPVCGGVVGVLPKPKSASVGAAEKAVEAARAAEGKAAMALRSGEIALQRVRQDIEHAGAQARKLTADLENATAELRAQLPHNIAPEPEAIAANLAVQGAAATAHAGLAKQRDTTRERLDELQPQVAQAAQEIAGCEADANRLLNEATEAGFEADEAKQQLILLCNAWPWDNVREAIEEKHDPGPVLQTLLQLCQSHADELTGRIAGLEQLAGRIERDIARAAELQDELTAMRERGGRYSELAKLLRADAFQAFVIEEAMQALADSASAHLATLYSRFAMTVEHGEFQVIDHWQADQHRAARTLSGGETFVASLALALALSERLPELRSKASAMLESLFLDEGFGTLDADVLEIVISALEGLRSQDRMVGIITHVPELSRRIESRIVVTKSPAGSSAAACS